MEIELTDTIVFFHEQIRWIAKPDETQPVTIGQGLSDLRIAGEAGGDAHRPAPLQVDTIIKSPVITEESFLLLLTYQIALAENGQSDERKGAKEG